jgi:HD-GYP domain-containing protein (c-di-GMP phosphodiesterase class II)
LSLKDQTFTRVSLEKIPVGSDGNVLVDVYIFLAHSQKYVSFVSKGSPLAPEQLAVLKTHMDPNLYVRAGALEAPLKSINHEAQKILNTETLTELNKKVRDQLRGILAFMNDDPEKAGQDGNATLRKMENLSEAILATVAPDVDDLRNFLLNNLKFVMLMEDAAALTSLAVMTAVAHTFDSRAIFRDLALAAMLMDTPLADFPEETLRQYYLDPQKIDPATLEKIRQHPITAAQAFSIRAKSFSPTVVQLILGHHELYNGKGYPKRTRSELLPAIARSFALAVDLFETMKRAELAGQSLSVHQALETLRELDVAPHLRRHNSKLVALLAEFVSTSRTPSA